MPAWKKFPGSITDESVTEKSTTYWVSVSTASSECNILSRRRRLMLSIVLGLRLPGNLFLHPAGGAQTHTCQSTAQKQWHDVDRGRQPEGKPVTGRVAVVGTLWVTGIHIVIATIHPHVTWIQCNACTKNQNKDHKFKRSMLWTDSMAPTDSMLHFLFAS